MGRLCLIIIVFFISIGCNQGSKIDCFNNTFVEIYNREKEKLNVQSGSNNHIVYDREIDKGNIGGEYLFSNSGQLSEYKFFGSSENYTYAEYYNNDGTLNKVEGNPIVFSNTEEVSYDSIKLVFFVFTLNKEIIIFQVKVNNQNWITLKPLRDSEFSNVKKYIYPLNTESISSIKYLSKLKYRNCGKEEKLAIDSSFIERKK